MRASSAIWGLSRKCHIKSQPGKRDWQRDRGAIHNCHYVSLWVTPTDGSTRDCALVEAKARLSSRDLYIGAERACFVADGSSHGNGGDDNNVGDVS